MATIRKRGDSWHAQIRRKGFKPITKSFTLRTDAQAWARKVESEMERGVFLDLTEAQQTTVSEVVGRYLKEILPTKKSQQGVTYHCKALNNRLGSYLLASLTSKPLADYRDERLKEVGPQSVKHELSILSRILNICIKDWGISLPHGNPALLVRHPKLPKGRDRRLQPGEEHKLLEALKNNPTMQAVILFALETAMRREEIANMEWKDVNLKTRVLKIPKTKTDTPRDIPLSSKALDVLKSIPRNIQGKVINLRPDSITQAFERACKRVEIEGLRFHDLRHEATSRLFEKGLNIMEVSSITGHKDLKMLKRYTHLRAETLASKLN